MFNLLAFSSNHDAMSDDKKKEELFGVEFRRCSLQMTFIFSAREEKKSERIIYGKIYLSSAFREHVAQCRNM